MDPVIGHSQVQVIPALNRKWGTGNQPDEVPTGELKFLATREMGVIEALHKAKDKERGQGKGRAYSLSLEGSTNDELELQSDLVHR